MCVGHWIAEIEKEELTRGVPSAQFWTQVQGVLAADCILGCNPLVAPSAFARSTLEGWGRLTGAPPASTVLNLLTLSGPEQRQLYLTHNGLLAGGIWYALTRKSTLDPQVRARLCAGAAMVYVFRRGTRTAAAKGSWRTGIVYATKKAEGRTLWASTAAMSGPQRLEDLRIRLSRLRLTADGVDPADPAVARRRTAPREGHIDTPVSSWPRTALLKTMGAWVRPSSLWETGYQLGVWQLSGLRPPHDLS
jgi:hypothetical protein